MRIVCPNCSSQYEVTTDAIPESGRDVQCANCSEVWFQERVVQEPEAPLALQTPVSEEDQSLMEQLQEAQIVPAAAEEEPVQDTAPPLSEVEQPKTATPVEPAPEAPEEAEQTAAVFKSLRNPSVQKSPADWGKEITSKGVTDEVKDILQEEAAFSSQIKAVRPVPEEETEDVGDFEDKILPDGPEDDVQDPIVSREAMPTKANNDLRATPKPEEEPVDLPPDVENIEQPSNLTRQLRIMEAEKEQQKKEILDRAIPNSVIDKSQDLTLSSAKNLRDVLSSEREDPKDTPAKDAPKIVKRPTEPTLNELGLKRPALKIETPDSLSEEKDSDVKSEDPVGTKNLVRKLDRRQGSKSVFTDIDKLNSKIDAAEEAKKEAKEEVVEDEIEIKTNRISPFSIGLAGAVLLATLTAGAYIFGPKISELLPQSEPTITSYRSAVDEQRMVLQDMYYQGGTPGFENLFNNAKSRFTSN